MSRQNLEDGGAHDKVTGAPASPVGLTSNAYSRSVAGEDYLAAVVPPDGVKDFLAALSPGRRDVAQEQSRYPARLRESRNVRWLVMSQFVY